MKKDDLKPKDRGLRQAVQRRAEAAGRMTPSADFTDRLMQRLPQPEKTPAVRRRLWLYPAAAVAAGLLLLVTLHFKYNKVSPEEPVMPAVIALVEEVRDTIAVKDTVSLVAEVRNREEEPRVNAGSRTQTVNPKAKKAKPQPQPEEPDTLGDGIWSQKEHVLLALRMLVECEAACEQRRGNAMVEAVFHASECPDGLQLVVSETGDYMIVENRQPQVLVL